ncbi:MAG: rod shape-determining protein RodA [Planctomycetota bacterium]|jgi:rod shape determining protein RodA|nr:rod shape-determining protein RodA [Planctomycetota bacterium]
MRFPPLHKLDFLVLAAVGGIVAIGLYYLQSVSEIYYRRQLVWAGVGAAALLTTLSVDYQALVKRAYLGYGAAFLLLVYVLLTPPIRGAHSWINLGFFAVQPSEIMKLALVLTLAAYLGPRDNQWTARGLVVPFLLLFLPLALILRQPDLGSAILLPPILFAMLFASGARITHLALIAAAGLAAAVPMWMFVLKAYQKNRIYAFLNPELYSAREAWQLIQSLIAIGQGGWSGMGWRNGGQNTLDLLPDKHTDFIFGIIAEEGGFVTAAALLAGYWLFVVAGLHIARKCREPRGKLIAVGVVTLIGFQALINIGVVTAVLPTTGITLPLVSYGGSSLVITLALVGLLLNVGLNNRVAFDEHQFTGGARSKG